MTSLYRQILNKAWLVTKKYPHLWLLGFFAAFLGNGGEYQVLIKQVRQVKLQPETIYNLQAWLGSASPNLDISLGRSLLLGLFIMVMLGLAALLIWLVVSSMAGLILGSAQASRDEKNSFSQLLREGRKNFWPVLGLQVIAKIIVYGILTLILAPLMLATFAQNNQPLNVFILTLTFLIFIPLTIVVSFVTRYASAFVVLSKQKLTLAFQNGWRLFAANWLISLEMALLLLAINLLAGLALLIVSFLLFSPFFFVGIASALQHPGTFWSIVAVPLIIIVLLTLALGAALATWQTASWTLLFLRLTEGGRAYSKLVRWIATLPEKFKRNKTKV